MTDRWANEREMDFAWDRIQGKGKKWMKVNEN